MNAFATICVVDVDARVPLVDRQKYAAAQQRQLVEQVAPSWGRFCGVRAATPDKPPLPGEVQVRLLDRPTTDGAFGYHDRLPDGTPIAYVFVGLARETGELWTSIASHEVLELLLNPGLSRCVQTSRGFEAVEVCDAVEQDLVYIDGVALSNFLLPEAFEPPDSARSVKFDYMGLMKTWDEVRPGGYTQFYDPRKGWVQFGEMSAYRTHVSKAGLSRGARRRALLRRPLWRRALSFLGF